MEVKQHCAQTCTTFGDFNCASFVHLFVYTSVFQNALHVPAFFFKRQLLQNTALETDTPFPQLLQENLNTDYKFYTAPLI